MPVESLVAVAFGIVGGAGAVAAIVAAPSGNGNVDTGALIGLKGLVAALVVRFGSPLNAMAAGLRPRGRRGDDRERAYRTLALGPSYREVVPLALVLLLVALRPPREAVEELE